MFHDVDDVVDGGEILERSFSPKFTTAVWAKSISCVAVRGVGRREFCRTAVVATVAFFCWSRTRVLPESKCSLGKKPKNTTFTTNLPKEREEEFDFWDWKKWLELVKSLYSSITYSTSTDVMSHPLFCDSSFVDFAPPGIEPGVARIPNQLHLLITFPLGTWLLS